MSDFDARLGLIEDRLHAKRLGNSEMSLISLSFDDHVEEDMGWLLKVVQGREREAEAAAEKAKEDFEQIKESILDLPQAFTDTDQLLLDAESKLKGLTRDVDAARKSICKMRDELGLFDAASEIQLHAARRELADVRSRLELEKEAHQNTREVLDAKVNALDAKVNALEVLRTKLEREKKDLQAKLDGLPPTWQERVLTGSGDLPEWVRVGASVKTTPLASAAVISGTIAQITLELITILTPVGEVVCAVDEFSAKWRKG